jgi:hypothetical protein
MKVFGSRDSSRLREEMHFINVCIMICSDILRFWPMMKEFWWTLMAKRVPCVSVSMSFGLCNDNIPVRLYALQIFSMRSVAGGNSSFMNGKTT